MWRNFVNFIFWVQLMKYFVTYEYITNKALFIAGEVSDKNNT